QANSTRCRPSSAADDGTTTSLGFDIGFCFPRDHIANEPIDVRRRDVLNATRAKQRYDVAMNAALIDQDGGRLLRSPPFPKHETIFSVLEILRAEFFHRDRLGIESFRRLAQRVSLS